MKWLRHLKHLLRLRRIFTGGEVEYVDPLQGETSTDELRAQANLENRQRDMAAKLKREGRSVLLGYQVPEPFVEDRISVHANRQGWVPPTEKKRQIRIARITDLSDPVRTVKG